MIIVEMIHTFLEKFLIAYCRVKQGLTSSYIVDEATQTL